MKKNMYMHANLWGASNCFPLRYCFAKHYLFYLQEPERNATELNIRRSTSFSHFHWFFAATESLSRVLDVREIVFRTFRGQVIEQWTNSRNRLRPHIRRWNMFFCDREAFPSIRFNGWVYVCTTVCACVCHRNSFLLNRSRTSETNIHLAMPFHPPLDNDISDCVRLYMTFWDCLTFS